MFPLNPFKRKTYILSTTLTHADAGRNLLRATDDYNRTAKRWFLVTTVRDDQFSTHLEQFAFQRGSGQWMSSFIVQADGAFQPTHDGSVRLTIGFQRSRSLGQIIWRVLLYLAILATIVNAFVGRFYFIYGTSFAIILAVTLVPWSIVAYFQGLWQAGKDWAILLAEISRALGSHMTVG